MTATDELRRLLDERGVEYETDDRNGLRETIWYGTAVFQLSPTAKMTMIVTPEQAIAATLGSEFNPDGLPVGLAISDDGNLLNWRGENYVKQSTLGSGTLTAEQVREAIMSADRWEKPMGNTGLTNTHLIIRSDGWQAIADELNSRAERTCELTFDGTDGNFGCSECLENIPPLSNYCPSCGAKVLRNTPKCSETTTKAVGE